ncbi:hypothetical protein NDU88_001706 [Pleurodeles waltl]|uniref:Uncharacterized protein n=1 Tax=Pleurodeles waltl TaxID=8319 RepID=A0AAV7RAP3_PLEWA|nr:hypothetical protein NDU88_001706 [Pleurodeles waltl]
MARVLALISPHLTSPVLRGREESKRCGVRVVTLPSNEGQRVADLNPGLSPVEAPTAQPVQKSEGKSGLSKTAKRNLKQKEKRKQHRDKGDPNDADELGQALGRTSLKADVSVRQSGVDGDAKSQQSVAEENAKPALAQPTPTADPAAV